MIVINNYIIISKLKAAIKKSLACPNFLMFQRLYNKSHSTNVLNFQV